MWRPTRTRSSINFILLITALDKLGEERWIFDGDRRRSCNSDACPKSCCFRWCQHLDPRVDAVNPFTHQEDRLIVKY